MNCDEKSVSKSRWLTMLHIAGFGYSSFFDRLRDFNGPIGLDEFSGGLFDFHQPLVNQPGEEWQYGVCLSLYSSSPFSSSSFPPLPANAHINPTSKP